MTTIKKQIVKKMKSCEFTKKFLESGKKLQKISLEISALKKSDDAKKGEKIEKLNEKASKIIAWRKDQKAKDRQRTVKKAKDFAYIDENGDGLLIKKNTYYLF